MTHLTVIDGGKGQADAEIARLLRGVIERVDAGQIDGAFIVTRDRDGTLTTFQRSDAPVLFAAYVEEVARGIKQRGLGIAE